MASATYQVTGMTCEHCVHAVASELKILAGVGDVTVDLVPGGTSAVTVTSDDPATAVPELAVGLAGAGVPGGRVGAWPFHRAAAVNAWHGAATMDTLVSVGVTAAYLWSAYALFSALRAGRACT